MIRACLAALLLTLAGAQGAFAHALDPGFLGIRAIGGGNHAVVWRVPAAGGAPMEIDAVLPEACAPRRAPSGPVPSGAGFESRWVAACGGDLAGGTLRIDGLERTDADVLARVETVEGRVATLRLAADRTSAEIPAAPGPIDIARAYALLGIDHILLGVDHLLFVFALLLLIRGRWLLVKTVSAFTLAHSITLSAAALGFVSVPGPPVEATIALSIVFLAHELALRRDGAPRLSERKPWLVAFAFGLLHGLGFAGALAETGLPHGDIPIALLTFNIGVEIGQLAFIAAVLVLRAGLIRLAGAAGAGPRAARAALAACAYVIGGVSAYWLIERVAAFVA